MSVSLSSSSSARLTGLLAVVVALVATLVAAPGQATAETTDETTTATGTVSGTVFHQLAFNGGRAPDGRVAIVDMDAEELETEVLADAAGDYTVELPVGTYAFVFYNSSNGSDFEEFFPEVYREKPLFTLDPNLVEVTEDAMLIVDANLAPLFFDMFDTVFTEDIAFLRNAGTTFGCNPEEGNTLYCPEDVVTRGQMAAFMVRFFDLTEVDESITFEDIDDSIFREDILRLATADITRGCNPDDGNTRFCPDEPVTRGQMAAFMVRAFEMKAIDESVDFEDIDGSIFHDDIRRLATADVTRGCNPDDGNTRFCPDEPVTRGQMAAFLKRAFEWDLADGEAAFMDAGAAQRSRPVATNRADLTDR